MGVLSVTGAKARVVVGNTSTGIYKKQPEIVLVDVSRIPELIASDVSTSGITIGAATSITNLERLLRSAAEGNTTAATVWFLVVV